VRETGGFLFAPYERRRAPMLLTYCSILL
jgi:hypothetical protein